MVKGVVAVAKTGFGMRALDTALLIMCIVRSWSWLLVMGQAWKGCTWWLQAGLFAVTGIGGALNLSMTSLITVGSSVVGSLVGGIDLCMASITSARRSYMRMGGSPFSILAVGDTVSGALGLRGCVIGSGSCSISLPKRSA